MCVVIVIALLEPIFLQDLTDRGWRRSGKYCYKPDNNKMCCPLFIVKCDAPNFKLSKSQKKVLKKLHAYLLTGARSGEEKTKKETVQQQLQLSSCANSSEDTTVMGPHPPMVGTSAKSNKSKPTAPPKKGLGADPTKPACRKAKDIRRERRMSKQLKTGQATGRVGETSLSTDRTSSATSQTSLPASSEATADMSKEKNGPKPLEHFLEFPSAADSPAHRLEVRLVQSNPPSAEFKESLAESYEVYKKYQMNIHQDPPDKVTMKQYTRFLVDSPLVPETGPAEWDIKYGSYHQQYYLDGRLIMVGVVDVLPNCLSSKYLYYDTDYQFLSMGVVSALNELKLVRKLHSANPSFQYYCMGYYNHTCPKMKYKGQYTPSFLLCTETNTYVPIEKCLPKLDSIKYTKLANEEEENEEIKFPVESYVESTLLLLGNQAVPYGVLQRATSLDLPQVKEYAKLVGPSVAKRALLAGQ